MTRAQFRRNTLLGILARCEAADPEEVVGYRITTTPVCRACYRLDDDGTAIVVADVVTQPLTCAVCRYYLAPRQPGDCR